MIFSYFLVRHFLKHENRGYFGGSKIRAFAEIGGFIQAEIPRIGGYFQIPRHEVYPLLHQSVGAGAASNSVIA